MPPAFVHRKPPVILANYIRLLGHDAKAHSATSSDIDLNRLAVEAGLAIARQGVLRNPFLGDRFGLAALTTTFEMTPDLPLATKQPLIGTRGPAWWSGYRTAKNAFNKDPFRRRNFVDGPHPFETLKRVDDPTTFIDEPRVPRVPKRTDMFARAQFGDMGKTVQDGARNGHYARKAPTASAQRRMLGAFVLLQDGTPDAGRRPSDAERNAANVKAASYFLGSRCSRDQPLPRLDVVQP